MKQKWKELQAKKRKSKEKIKDTKEKIKAVDVSNIKAVFNGIETHGQNTETAEAFGLSDQFNPREEE